MRYLVSGSMRTLQQLCPQYARWLGFFLSPRNQNSVASIVQLGLPWAVDNGAYSGFDPKLFRRLLIKIKQQPRCLFVVCPDVVANATATLEMFDRWFIEVSLPGQPVALVAQDGAEALELPWVYFDCLFVGGSTAWKLSRASCDLMAEAKRRGKAVHVGRVNSYQRLTFAFNNQADSCDGSSASRFSDKFIRRYCSWLRDLDRQKVLF